MAQAVRAGGLEHAGFQPSFFKRALQNRFMEVMPALFSSNSIGEMTGCRKNPLAAPRYVSVFSRFFSEGIVFPAAAWATSYRLRIKYLAHFGQRCRMNSSIASADAVPWFRSCHMSSR